MSEEDDKAFELQFEVVPLHPDLVPHVCENSLGAMIHHKLIISIMHHERLNKTVNAQYEFKKAKVDAAKAEKDWSLYVFLHERPYRLDAFSEISGQWNDPASFWQLVGSIWQDSENIYQNRGQWLKLWSSTIPNRSSVMDEEDQEALAALPETFKVYRGVSRAKAAQGLSWTLDYDKAVWFSKRAMRVVDSAGKPVVVEGAVQKSDVLAHFTGRNEDEIVILPQHVKDRKITKINYKKNSLG